MAQNTAISVTAYFSLTSEETPVKIFEAATNQVARSEFFVFFFGNLLSMSLTFYVGLATSKKLNCFQRQK